MGWDWREQTGDEGPDARAQTAAAAAGISGTPLIIPSGLTRRHRDQLQAADLTPLGNTETRDICIGWNSGSTIAWPVVGFKYMTYSVISEKPVMLTMAVALDAAGPWAGYFTQTDAIGGTLLTPYTLPAPYNRNGFLVIVRPYLSIQLTDMAGAAHTYTRLYVKVWN